MMLPIRFSYQNALQSVVGDHGLSPADINQDAALEALHAFRRRVDTGEIGFPSLPLDQNTNKEIQKFADSIRGDIEAVLLLGIGGSALGAYALDTALRGPHPLQMRSRKEPRLVVMDNIDPGFVAACLEGLSPKRTVVCVVTKSGSTVETLSTFMIVHAWMTAALGAKKAASRIVAVTDETKGDLLAIAKAEKYPTFFIPENVGGRFSVFSPAGMVPAAIIGLDIGRILRGARDANHFSWSSKLEQNPALQSATIHYALDGRKAKKVEVVFAYSSFLWSTAFWYRQLWAESLGKRLNRNGEIVYAGQTPVAALGVTDQHSQLQLYIEGPHDKTITFWAIERCRLEVKIPSTRNFSKYDSTAYLQGQSLGQLFHAERVATETALADAGRPNCRWTLPRVDDYHLGMFFELLEFQTAFAGELYGVNAFDQPGVELGKKLTNGLMGKKGFEEYAARFKKERVAVSG